jgi:hypothetical protein
LHSTQAVAGRVPELNDFVVDGHGANYSVVIYSCQE